MSKIPHRIQRFYAYVCCVVMVGCLVFAPVVPAWGGGQKHNSAQPGDDTPSAGVGWWYGRKMRIYPAVGVLSPAVSLRESDFHPASLFSFGGVSSVAVGYRFSPWYEPGVSLSFLYLGTMRKTVDQFRSNYVGLGVVNRLRVVGGLYVYLHPEVHYNFSRLITSAVVRDLLVPPGVCFSSSPPRVPPLVLAALGGVGIYLFGRVGLTVAVDLLGMDWSPYTNRIVLTVHLKI